MNELLKLLKNNAKESPENLAKLLGQSAEDVSSQIDAYEKEGII